MIPEELARLRDPRRFQDLVRPYRRELAAHCYRMLGSLADAEDQVQETLLSAWNGVDGFEGRSSLRSWLYKIATNRCLDLLRRQARRSMPAEHGEPHDPSLPLPEIDGELSWVDPCPALMFDGLTADPEALYSTRESVQLAFIVALQHLPATQRSILILRDVLGWSAPETAELLETSVASINSALQRARAALESRRGKRPALPRRDDPEVARLLSRYVRAWESSDVDTLVTLLHEDAIASMPPVPAWFRGPEAIGALIRPRIGPPGGQRVLTAEGADVAFGFYRRDKNSGIFEYHAVQVIELEGTSIIGIHAFLDPSLHARFGLPATV